MNDDGIARIFLIIFIVLNVLRAFFPEYAWWIEHGMPKDAEPSDSGVFVMRLGGIGLAVLGCIFLFITFY